MERFPPFADVNIIVANKKVFSVLFAMNLDANV